MPYVINYNEYSKYRDIAITYQESQIEELAKH